MLDLLIVLAFVAFTVSQGFLNKKQASQSLEEFFLAGRSIKGWRAGCSMAATQFAADTPLLITGLIATGGIFLLWQLWIYGLAFLLMGFVFSGMWRRAGVLTDAELAELRYSGHGTLALRTLKALYYGTIINCVVMAFVLVAGMTIAETFLLWHEWLPSGLYETLKDLVTWSGIDLARYVADLEPAVAATNNLISLVVLLVFIALYATTGGLRSVIITDTVQFVIALGATLLYAVYVVVEVGGMDALMDRLTALYGEAATAKMLSFSPAAAEAALPFLTIIALQWFFQMNSDGTGYLAQRSMACYSDRQARIAALVFTWAQVLLRSLIWIVIAAGLLVLYPFTPADMGAEGFKTAREATFVTGIDELLPPGVRGLMLTGMLAALASTIDTHLNLGASYWSNDIYRRLINEVWLKRAPKNKELVLVARLANLLILAVALSIMSQLDSIQEGWKISLLFGAGVGSVIVLRWLWERITVYAELAGMAVSLVAGIVLMQALPDPDQEAVRIGLMALLSTTAVVGITFLTPATDPTVLDAFYRRVRPMGFWGKTATRVGDEPRLASRALGRGLALVALVGGSLYLSLAGFGKLLLPAPGDSSLTAWLMVAGALALVPFWWKAAVGGSDE